MNKRDQQLLAEAYQQIEEGIWDRVKARGSQAVGLAKGAKDWGKGAAKGTWGRAVGAAGKGIQKAVDATFEDAPKQNKLLKKAEKLKKAGAADRSVLKTSGQEAKYASYIKNSANTIVNDLNKLGMEVADPDALNQELQKLVSKHLTQVSAQGHLKRDVSGMKPGIDRTRAKYAGKKVGPQNRGTRTNVNEPLPDV